MSIYTLMHVPAGIFECTSVITEYGTFDEAMIACVKADNTADQEHPDSYYYVITTKHDSRYSADYENYGHHCAPVTTCVICNASQPLNICISCQADDEWPLPAAQAELEQRERISARARNRYRS